MPNRSGSLSLACYHVRQSETNQIRRAKKDPSPENRQSFEANRGRHSAKGIQPRRIARYASLRYSRAIEALPARGIILPARSLSENCAPMPKTHINPRNTFWRWGGVACYNNHTDQELGATDLPRYCDEGE